MSEALTLLDQIASAVSVLRRANKGHLIPTRQLWDSDDEYLEVLTKLRTSIRNGRVAA